MTEKIPLSEQQILDCLKLNYGIEGTTLACLPLGADMDALIFKAQAKDRSSYFVKLKRGRDQRGVAVTEFLRNAGVQHVIPIHRTIRGEKTQILGDFTVTVSPFIEGKDGFNTKLTNDQWKEFGKVMRQIHEIEIPPSIQSLIRRETYSPKWRKAVRALYPLLDSELSGDEVALQLSSFLKAHKDEICRLVDRAEQLGLKAQGESPQYVLCHSDIHGGNILLNEKGSLYILDWEDPIMAPKERDLMFIGGGVANVWNNPHEEELFYQGYGKTAVNKTLLAYYRHERIVEDIALYTQQLLLTREGGQDRIKWYKEMTDQFEPRGVVEIAFKTDEDLKA